MSDKIRDYTGALPPPEPDKESEIDPAKFKKVLKVEESEESQKKDKRRLKKQEEEGEEDKEVQGEEATPNASTAFGDFMTDQDEVEGLFDAQSSKGQARESSADKPTPFKMVSDTELPPADHEDVQGQPAAMVGDLGEAPPSQTPRLGGEEAQSPPPPPTEDGEVYTPPPPPPEEPPPQYSQQPPEEPPPPPSYDQVTEQQQRQKDAPKQKKKEVDSSLLAGKTKRGALKKAKEEKAKAPIYVGKKAKAEAEEEVAQVAPTEKKEPAKKAPSKEERKVGEKEGVKPTPEQAAALGEQETPSEKRKGDEEEEQAPTFSIEGAVTTPEGIVTIEQPSETPAYTKLNPQVFELFERMVGVLTVQQNTGVTTTTITLSMKNSVFDGAEITLDHYSTAPNSFNVRLQGSPEAIQLFNANIEDLMTAFQQTKSPYTVNILSPSLQKKYRMVKKKGEGDSGDTGQEQQK